MHTRHERTISSPVVRPVVAAATALLLFAPGIAWITGSRGRPADNKAPVAFSGFDHGWSSLSSFGTFLADRLPLRSSAIRTDGWIDQRVFREDPAFGGSATPEVLRGSHGQLFLRNDFVAACRPANGADASVTALTQLATIIRDSGRDVVTMVPPDKSSVLADDLPAAFPERQCWQPYHAALTSALAQSMAPGWIDLRELLNQRRAVTGHDLYLPLDSHWDAEGSLLAVRAMVDVLAPGLFDESEIADAGMQQYTGDLTFLMGSGESGTTHVLEVRRPGITYVSGLEASHHVTRWVSTGAAGRLIPGQTVLLGDSFAARAIAQIIPYFADLTFVSIYETDPVVYSDAIRRADQVVVMIVERNLADTMDGTLGRSMRDQLTASLAG